MAANFKTHLATEIFSEHRTLSYRVLSRQLKVHVNDAKCMLYEFYERENKKKPGSVYATYLICGIKKDRNLAGSDYVYEAKGGSIEPTYVPSTNSPYMPGSFSSPTLPALPSSSRPFTSSPQRPPPPTKVVLEERDGVPLTNITVCREEELDGVKSQFEEITDIHIYSLSASRPPYRRLFRDTARVVFNDYHAVNDPLIHNKDYGIIQNPKSKRRKLNRRPPGVEGPRLGAQPHWKNKRDRKKDKAKAETKVDTKPASPTTTPPEDVPKTETKKEEDSAPPSRPASRASVPAVEAGTKSKASLKRDDSALFKAFAKQSAKPKLERKDTSTSTGSDVKMGGMDDNDEGEDDDAMFLDAGMKTKKRSTAEVQKDIDDRQAKLRKMMDDDADEPEVPKISEATDMDAEPPAAKAGEDSHVPATDGDQVDWPDSDTERTKETAQEDQAPKKRRGKRKVKKRTTKTDADGYLVTQETEVWESFSEDEPEAKPAPAAIKKQPVEAKSSAPAKSQQKPAGKPGGKGNLMSYFGKK